MHTCTHSVERATNRNRTIYGDGPHVCGIYVSLVKNTTLNHRTQRIYFSNFNTHRKQHENSIKDQKK